MCLRRAQPTSKKLGRGIPVGRIAITLSLLCAAWVTPVALAHAEPPDSRLSGHELLRFLHLLLFVFWIGPDVASYVVARTTVDPAMNAAQRLAAARMLPVIDLLPRVCISLMLTVGGILSEYVGLEHPPWQMAGIVLLGPVWLVLMLLAALREGTATGRQAVFIDQWLRALIAVAVVASVAWSTATGRLAEAPYVGGKLLLFAAILACGWMVRRRLQPFRDGLLRLEAVGRSADLDRQMADSFHSARPFMFAIWVALLAAALMGVAQPGATPDSSAALRTLPPAATGPGSS